MSLARARSTSRDAFGSSGEKAKGLYVAISEEEACKTLIHRFDPDRRLQSTQ